MTRSFKQMGEIIFRAERRWQRRYRIHGSWAHPAVVEAMYLMKALYVERRRIGGA